MQHIVVIVREKAQRPYEARRKERHVSLFGASLTRQGGPQSARHKQERASAGFQQLIRGASEEEGIARPGGDAQDDQGVVRSVRLIEDCDVGPVGNLDLRAQSHVIVIGDFDDLLEHSFSVPSRHEAASLLYPIGRGLRRGNIENGYFSVGSAREFNTDLRSASGNGSASNRGQNLDRPADRIVIVHPARHDDRGRPVIGPRGLGNFWMNPPAGIAASRPKIIRS